MHAKYGKPLSHAQIMRTHTVQVQCSSVYYTSTKYEYFYRKLTNSLLVVFLFKNNIDNEKYTIVPNAD